jgi:hypothetical protein
MGEVNKMNATKQIIDILSACGCKPAATIDNNGNAVIKVNAPTVETVTTLFDSDLEEYEHTNGNQ